MELYYHFSLCLHNMYRTTLPLPLVFNLTIWRPKQHSYTATDRMECEALPQTVLCSENYKKHVSLLRVPKAAFLIL
jgi:hypothetical protein